MFFYLVRTILTISLFLFVSCLPEGAFAENGETEQFGIKEQPVHRETVLDLVFGSTPRLPTERGILVIDAFVDLDNNGIKSDNEPELRNEITCRVDNTDYKVPAFIPGLDYNNRYEIRCSGNAYYPTMPDKEILIEHRGHVIEIALPCRQYTGDSSTRQ